MVSAVIWGVKNCIFFVHKSAFFFPEGRVCRKQIQLQGRMHLEAPWSLSFISSCCWAGSGRGQRDRGRLDGGQWDRKQWERGQWDSRTVGQTILGRGYLTKDSWLSRLNETWCICPLLWSWWEGMHSRYFWFQSRTDNSSHKMYFNESRVI